ncbi:MAG TPA: hypothetical protein VMM18_12750 [Gemmatimonadaceae bacterium]|nr:hypothetical protein [Gemmatimonadaceae bacterium]
MNRPRLVNQVGPIIHYPFVPLYAEPVVVAAGEYAYFGDGSEPQVYRVDSAGAVEKIIRWRPAHRVRTREVWEWYKTETLAEMNEDGRTASARPRVSST